MSTHEVHDGGELPVRVGVCGASGTTGAELVKLLAVHPRAQLVFATAERHAGSTLDLIDPSAPAVLLQPFAAVDPADCEVLFVCLPHGEAAAAAARGMAAGARVIDLSGDLRLRDPRLHAQVYGSPRDPTLAAEAVYGLTEHNREAIASARLISNPGCFPTSVALALGPLYAAGVVHGTPIIDAKSGVSGAGRSATASTHFCSAANAIMPYKIGRQHRHVAEIEQTLGWLGGAAEPPQVVFIPHLLPVERGILSTITVPVGQATAADLHGLLVDAYRDEAFVGVLPEGRAARLRAVVGSNRAQLSVHEVEGTELVVVVSAIDNLLKGAAGQALQNMNLMLGLPEALGVPGAAVERSRLQETR